MEQMPAQHIPNISNQTSTVDIGGDVAANGPQAPAGKRAVKAPDHPGPFVPHVDNRVHLDVDPKKVETWEIMIFEDRTVRIADLLMIFSRYASNGRGLISPGLPSEPVDELTDEQRAEIQASEAFKLLRRFSLPNLRLAAQSFADQAKMALDPN